MAYSDAKIFSLGADGIKQVTYEDIEHFQVTRSLLNPGKEMLRELMS